MLASNAEITKITSRGGEAGVELFTKTRRENFSASEVCLVRE